MISTSATFWLLLNLLSIVFLGFYSMMEMACVSFNKVRLHYYVSEGKIRAKWLNYLLQHPFRLFGTTLVGVNVAMFVGSECAREFHSAIGLSPDFAPLTQVLIVIILGELAPMFAARHYAEHVALLGVPFVYASARLLTPVLWIIGWISKITNFILKGKTSHGALFLNQEELQKILEEHTEESQKTESQDFNTITQNIFRMRHEEVTQAMMPLNMFPSLPSNGTVAQMRAIINKTQSDFVLVYHRNLSNIVGIAFPRDLVRAQDTRRVRQLSRPPWFVTSKTKLTQILQQFQRNNETVAIILDSDGKAAGLVALDDLLAEIFGMEQYKAPKKPNLSVIERTFAGDMLLSEFNQQFDEQIDHEEDLTLSQLMIQQLGHIPEVGESIFIDPFELVAKETSLLEVRSLIVRKSR